MKKPLVCLITCERSWNNKIAFDQNFLRNRDQFDLAVVFNGNSPEGLAYIESVSKPEYLLQRANLGMDLAGFDYAIKNTPRYETYIFLHDDHWFIDDAWPSLVDLLYIDASVDVLGNILSSRVYPPPHHKIISTVLGYEKYQLEKYPHFLQGLAGFYKRKVVDCMLAHGGIPHLLDNHREFTFVAERIHSFILLDNGIKFGQIPPGNEQYLKHKRP
jgi:hypothetical protein